MLKQLLKTIRHSGEELITHPKTHQQLPLRMFLTSSANLSRIPLFLIQRSPLQTTNKDTQRAFVSSHDLIDFFSHFPYTLSPQELVNAIAPLLPRFYSIASSQRVSPHTIDLLVATFTYHHGAKLKHGLGSQFLCETATPQQTLITAYIQKAPYFSLPNNLDTPIIMIGAGTGVAPYRAFLQERIENHAKGQHWLFFGERNYHTDFYYQDFFESLVSHRQLRLDLAFSRDQKEKRYVQHLIQDQEHSIWEMIQHGAYIYLCGDAKQMAKSVKKTLEKLITKCGNTNGHEYLKI